MVNPLSDAFAIHPGISSHPSDCIAFFGHVDCAYAAKLQSISLDTICTLKPDFRIKHTLAIASCAKERVAFAKFISDRSRLLLLAFLKSEYAPLYKELADNTDHGLFQARANLDCIEREELRLLALAIAFELLSNLPSLPIYAVVAHDPHGLCDQSIYFALRYFGITVYSFRWLAETCCSLIFRNILDKAFDPYSLSVSSALVVNCHPIPGIAESWYQSILASTSSGSWLGIDTATKALGAKPFLPSSPLSVSIAAQKATISCHVKNVLLSILAPIRLFSRLVAQGPKSIARNVSLRSLAYRNYCIQGQVAVDDACYVYVPLHLQPENTTSTFGCRHSNQILFLRKIRSIIDPDVMIVVKDHPFNSLLAAYPRSLEYQNYLSLVVPGVVFCPLSTLSKDLISDALCTFSVNGTACLESAMIGKPSVFGGTSFYVSLPNVAHIDQFATADSFSDWLAKSLESPYPDARIKQFFLSRQDYIFDCVTYGPVLSSRGLVPAFDSMNRDRQLLD